MQDSRISYNLITISMKIIHLFFACFFLSNYLSANDIKISTSSGLVTGNKTKNVIIFEDIPYAKPPIENLRWKAPRAISSSEKIFPKENNFCVQRPSNLGGVYSESFYVGTEDCLYLDIFTPKNSSEKKLPVMFWIHGGGNTSGLKDLYDFSKLVSRHKVIVVRINYRLGPFGWFTHPSIQGFQDGDDKTSNFGTLDIVMALKWVNKNISNFGGDPNNITIFGESAGGHNVLSLLVSNKAKGLFHKAISMSGYTTTSTLKESYDPKFDSSNSNFSSKKVVEKVFKELEIENTPENTSDENVRKILYSISTEDFFKIYAERKTYEEIPLLVADGVVIPKIGLKEALAKTEYVNNVPTIAGSNKDEVKLWLATARYFVDLEYSFFGSILNVPKVKLIDEDAFEAFNYYRSSAWKIRGVDEPLSQLKKAGNNNLYSYRYDWDDHRRLVVADFKKLIGAAHATEIPLLTGNTDLVGGYPLSDLIYPPSFSKRYLSKNMMQFWSNFAKSGLPGSSSNSIFWDKYIKNNDYSNFIILDRKRKLKMSRDNNSYQSLINQLSIDDRLTELEKCVVLLQMFTYVGNDIYDNHINSYPMKCSREDSEKFLKDNASFIEY